MREYSGIIRRDRAILPALTTIEAISVANLHLPRREYGRIDQSITIFFV
jgi:hypothetical protein